MQVITIPKSKLKSALIITWERCDMTVMGKNKLHLFLKLAQVMDLGSISPEFSYSRSMVSVELHLQHHTGKVGDQTAACHTSDQQLPSVWWPRSNYMYQQDGHSAWSCVSRPHRVLHLAHGKFLSSIFLTGACLPTSQAMGFTTGWTLTTEPSTHVSWLKAPSGSE